MNTPYLVKFSKDYKPPGFALPLHRAGETVDFGRSDHLRAIGRSFVREGFGRLVKPKTPAKPNQFERRYENKHRKTEKERIAAVAQFIRDHPETLHKDVAVKFGITSSNVSYVVMKMRNGKV